MPGESARSAAANRSARVVVGEITSSGSRERSREAPGGEVGAAAAADPSGSAGSRSRGAPVDQLARVQRPVLNAERPASRGVPGVGRVRFELARQYRRADRRVGQRKGPGYNARPSSLRSTPMSLELIGRKLGMTQIFYESGDRIPVTVIQAGPCTGRADEDRRERRLAPRSRSASRRRSAKHTPKAMQGHFAKAKHDAQARCWSRWPVEAKDLEGYQVGQAARPARATRSASTST